MEIRIDRDASQDVFVVHCPEQMDWNVRDDLAAQVRGFAGQSAVRGLIVDMEGVRFINSAGIGALFTTLKYVRESGGAMVVARAGAPIRRLLDTVNLGRLIPIVSSLAEARQAVGSEAKDARFET